MLIKSAWCVLGYKTDLYFLNNHKHLDPYFQKYLNLLEWSKKRTPHLIVDLNKTDLRSANNFGRETLCLTHK